MIQRNHRWDSILFDQASITETSAHRAKRKPRPTMRRKPKKLTRIGGRSVGGKSFSPFTVAPASW